MMEEIIRKTHKGGIRIGSHILPHGLLLAPMAGVTDGAFRSICRAHGAEYTVTEMVSAKALWYRDKKTKTIARLSAEEQPAAVQIFGSDVQCMAYAAQVLSQEGEENPAGMRPAAIDINMGCPMPKIAGNGDGAALMKDPVLAGKIVEAVKKATDLPVTVKIRAGWDAEHINCVEIAKVAAACGADMIVVHGRTRAQMYAPPVDLSCIAAVREAVEDHIPVIGNGDIQGAADALAMMEKTGCDGVMVARGAYGNPWIFEEIAAAMDGTSYTRPPLCERMKTALRHFDLLVEEKGDYTGVQEGRKHLAWYTKGLRGSAALRGSIMAATSPEAMRTLLLPYLSGEISDNGEEEVQL